MTIDQLAGLLTNAAQPAIFAALFIWLFTETRKDNANLLIWYQQKMETAQDNERKNTEAMRELTGAIQIGNRQNELIMKSIEAINAKLEAREARTRG